MVGIFFSGLALGASLIIAIGAQNAFVLSQGVRRRFNFIIPLICSVSDAVLISIGVLGVGSVIASQPVLSTVMTIGGALFLFWYGFRSFRLFLKPKGMEDDVQGPNSLKAAVMTTLALTLLNPHVYLDTIVLLGSISSQYEGNGRLVFGAGAVSASFLWFFALSLGGRILSPIFKKPLAWRIMDICITVVMWSIAASLVVSLF